MSAKDQEQSKHAAEQPKKPKVRHFGDLIRHLRQAAGLSRVAFGESVGLDDMVLKAIETRRYLPTHEQLDRVLADPTMADLLEWAERDGVPIELLRDPGGGGAQDGESGRTGPQNPGEELDPGQKGST